MDKSGITPRKINIDLDENIPRHWANGSAFMTHMLNTYTLLVPDNEAYYIRHLNACMDNISDEKLKRQLQNFCRQESQHGVGHKSYWPLFDSLGLKYRGFVKGFGWFNYRFLEPILPRMIHLANIACIEHINAYIGSFYLERDLLRNSDPKMRFLYYWHFAEEIEHKAVAFDVFMKVGGNYPLRLLGGLLVFPIFYLVNTAGTFYLLAQEGLLFKWKTWRDFGRFLFRDGAMLHAFKNMTAFMLPGFKPWNTDDHHLSEIFFAEEENKPYYREFPAS